MYIHILAAQQARNLLMASRRLARSWSALPGASRAAGREAGAPVRMPCQVLSHIMYLLIRRSTPPQIVNFLKLSEKYIL